MLRAFVFAAAFLVVCVTGSASAATQVAKDRDTGVTFRLAGHLLTVSVTEPPEVIGPPERLMGHKITAVCGTRLAEGRGRLVLKARRWPKGRPSLRFWLRRDFSAHVRWCVVEQWDGTDVAGVVFKKRR